MATYTIEMTDETGTSEAVKVKAESLAEAREMVRSEAEDWVSGGEWGDEGASVGVRWRIWEDDGGVVDEDGATVEVEPNHRALIRAAGGNPDCDHDWTAEGEGGCDENPGVWGGSGTRLTFATHCRKCGLHLVEVSLGSQRNPGEHDTVRYEQSETWCSLCERVDCECEGVS